MSYVLGLDLGGSSIKAVAVTPAGDTLASVSEPFEDRDMQWAARMRALVERLQQERGGPAQARTPRARSRSCPTARGT